MPLARVLSSWMPVSTLPWFAFTVPLYTTCPSMLVTSTARSPVVLLPMLPLMLNAPLFGFGISFTSMAVVVGCTLSGNTVMNTQSCVPMLAHTPLLVITQLIES